MKDNLRTEQGGMIGIVLVMMIMVFAFGQTAFAASPTPLTGMQSQTGTVGRSLCADPSVKLLVSKMLIANTAKITLIGTVCNTGLGDYADTAPMDAFFMVQTWHPPKTAAMESDTKVFSHNAVGNTLKKGECKTFTQFYIISGVANWGETAKNNLAKPAVKEFTFGVDRKYPMNVGDTSFSKAENCKIENDRASSVINYMELMNAPSGGSLPGKGATPRELHPDWLNPQPEPPLPLNQLNPQPDPPLPK